MQRGVSASKEDVHNAIKNLDKGLFPKAFCKIVPDFLTGSNDHCIVMHADGAGTKSSLAYMYWKETGDLSVWKGIAQDALIMNIDDQYRKRWGVRYFSYELFFIFKIIKNKLIKKKYLFFSFLRLITRLIMIPVFQEMIRKKRRKISNFNNPEIL